jgi:hypothetical protein
MGWMPSTSGRFGCSILLVCGLAAPASAQSVTWFQFDPLVIPSTQTQPVLLEAGVTGAPSRVSLELNAGGTIEMKDDASGGDRRAGDGVFTASLPAATILSSLRSDDVQRVFVGFLNLFNGSTSVFRGNMFADVHTADVSTSSIAQLAPDVQVTSRLVNIVDPAYFADSNVRRVAQTFYRHFGDSYDFLNVIATPSRFANRTHTVVRNDVDGIGLPRSDLSAQFGSGGRLRGYTLFPIPDFYDGASTGYSHETGHQWINQLRFGAFAAGVPHWPPSTMATGTMGFSIGGAGGQGGDFRCKIVEGDGIVQLLTIPTAESPVFNDFDLYLMGLLDPAAVQPQLVFPGLTTPPPCGGTYIGTVTRVTVDTIISGAGRRAPEWSASPSAFRAASILVSRDGLVSRETMWLYSWLTARAELQASTPIHEGFTKAVGNPFFVMTGGRATIDTLLSSDPDFSVRADQAAVTVPKGTPATFRISVMPTRASFDQPVALSCGAVPAPLTCAFSAAQLTPGAAGADVTLTVTTGLAASMAPAAVQAITAVLWILAAFAGRRWRRISAASAAVSLLLVARCGGGSPPTSPTTPPAAGLTVYTITVTGTAGALTHGTILTLTVQ